MTQVLVRSRENDASLEVEANLDSLEVTHEVTEGDNTFYQGTMEMTSVGGSAQRVACLINEAERSIFVDGETFTFLRGTGTDETGAAAPDLAAPTAEAELAEAEDESQEQDQEQEGQQYQSAIAQLWDSAAAGVNVYGVGMRYDLLVDWNNVSGRQRLDESMGYGWQLTVPISLLDPSGQPGGAVYGVVDVLWDGSNWTASTAAGTISDLGGDTLGDTVVDDEGTYAQALAAVHNSLECGVRPSDGGDLRHDVSIDWRSTGSRVPLESSVGTGWRVVAPVAVVSPDTGEAGKTEQCEVTVWWDGSQWALLMSSDDLARIEPEPVASDA